MNMVFLRRRRFKAGAWSLLADGDGKRTVKGRRPGFPQAGSGDYDNPSISSSLKSPDTMVTGIGNEPTVLAMVEMIGPGPSGPGLAASTSIAISTSLSITSRIW